MIIGRGLIANAFVHEFMEDQEVTIFASGVSNSNEVSKDAFLRESTLLKKVIADDSCLLVYFSTCSIGDLERHNTPYVRHKIEMENLVAQSGQYLILRLPQVVGKTYNPYTLTNYLHSQIESGSHFTIWNKAWRNLIDIDDIAKIATYMIRKSSFWNHTFNIASPFPICVIDLVGVFERILGVKADYEVSDRGDHYDIDVVDAMYVAQIVGVEFGSDYVEKVIKKYYG